MAEPFPEKEHPGIGYMPEGAWAYILGASPVTPSVSTLALSTKVRRSRQEMPAIEEVYR